MQRRDVHLQLHFAAENAFLLDALIVEARRHQRLGVGGIRVDRLILELLAAQVEIALVAETGQINLRRLHGVAVAGDFVGRGEVLVRLHHDVPAERPALTEGELRLRADHAAFGVVEVGGGSGEFAGRRVVDVVAGKGVRVVLADAGGLQREEAVLEGLAVLGLGQETLLGVVGAGQGHVLVVGNVDEIRGAQAVAEIARRLEGRGQETGLALDRRVRRLEVRHVGDRHAEQLELGAVVAHFLLGLVPDDPAGLHLPERRPIWVFAAGFAGRVDALLEGGDAAVLTHGVTGGETGVVRGLDPQRLDEAVAEIIGDVDAVRVDLISVRLLQFHIARSHQTTGVLVVGDVPRDQLVAAIVDPHTAGSGDDGVVGIVGDGIGFQEHLGVVRH